MSGEGVGGYNHTVSIEAKYFDPCSFPVFRPHMRSLGLATNPSHAQLGHIHTGFFAQNELTHYLSATHPQRDTVRPMSCIDVHARFAVSISIGG